MSDYLARLKTIEKEKIFLNISESEVPKVPKAPFDTFDTSIKGEIEKKNINFSDLKREERREKVLKILADNPDSQRAIITDLDSDRDNVILTMAIRGVASFEMLVSKDKYDPFKILQLLGVKGTHESNDAGYCSLVDTPPANEYKSAKSGH